MEKMYKLSSVIDWALPGLSPDIWDGSGKLYPFVKKQIFDHVNRMLENAEFKNHKTWLNTAKVIGSLTSYRYAYNSDLDVHFVTDLKKINDLEFEGKLTPEEVNAKLEEVSKRINVDTEVLILNTHHPIEITFENEFKGSKVLDGEYDLFKDEWIKKPRTIDWDFDPEVLYSEIYQKAFSSMEDWDVMIGSIKRDLISLEDLIFTFKSWAQSDAEKAKFFEEKLKAELKILEDDIAEYVSAGTAAKESRRKTTKKGVEIAYDVIFFKLLARFGYLWIYRKLKDFVGEDKHLDINSVDFLKPIFNIK